MLYQGKGKYSALQNTSLLAFQWAKNKTRPISSGCYALLQVKQLTVHKTTISINAEV